MNNSSWLVADAVSIPLAGVSTIACIIALGVLLYYKMWRSFIYRLVLYIFISLIVFSLNTMMLMLFYLNIFNEVMIWYQEIDWQNKNGLYIAFVVPIVLCYSCLATAYLLMTSITVCIYLMALHNYQFTYKSDLLLLFLTVLYLTIVIILLIILACDPPNKHYYMQEYLHTVTVIFILLCLPFLVNILFVALALVPLCCRACGYNLCMKTVASIESHRKALREILPFFILIVPSFLFFLLYPEWFFGKLYYYEVMHAIFTTPGLVSVSSFALHLYFIRKKLKRLRGRKQTITARHTHRTTFITSEGISETCNTECPLLSESTEDERYLLMKNNYV